MTITSEPEWRLLDLVAPQRGDILIKKVFAAGSGIEKAIVFLQKAQNQFNAGHESAEHAAICIGPLFVAEAEGAGVVANSLVTADRGRTKYVVYRHRDPAIRELAASIAESVARGRNTLVYTRATRTMGGGYKLAGAAASLFSGPGHQPVTARVETWPSYVLNLVRYYTDGTYFTRDWAFCSMFACGCFEAACLLNERLDWALRVNPAMVSPREYEHRLEDTHQAYQRVGRYLHVEDMTVGNSGRHVELFEKIKQAVEDYHKTHRGGGVTGGQALKARFGFRSVSPESQRALIDLTRWIRYTEALRRSHRFTVEVESLYLCVLYFISAPRTEIAPIGFSEELQAAIDGMWGTATFKRTLQSGAGLGAPLNQKSTFYEILTNFNRQLVQDTNARRRSNRLGTRLA